MTLAGPSVALASIPMTHGSAQDRQTLAVRTVAGHELTAAELHAILDVRIRVFVVEQRCPYRETDGLDLRSDTWHRWLPSAGTEVDIAASAHQNRSAGTGPDDPAIASYLRVLAEPGGFRIGRVVTPADHRGRGLAGLLLANTIEWLDQRDDPTRRQIVLSAQSHLVDFYRRHGFTPCGTEYVEDDIPHTPMVRS